MTYGLAVISKEWMLSQCSTIIAPLQVVNNVAAGQQDSSLQQATTQRGRSDVKTDFTWRPQADGSLCGRPLQHDKHALHPQPDKKVQKKNEILIVVTHTL